MTGFATLADFQTALERARAEPAAVAALCGQARGSSDLLDRLPPRFAQVLLPVLDSLESSSLFSEESCSFSQRDLLDSLQSWLDAAAQRLG